MKLIKSIVASAKVFLTFFIHLHIVKIREIKNVKNRHFSSFSDVFHIFILPNFDKMQMYEKGN